jgi:plasmid maintenance system killer protein
MTGYHLLIAALVSLSGNGLDRPNLAHADRAHRTFKVAICNLRDMNRPGWHFHPLKGDLNGHYAVWVDENWRLTFRFDGEHAELVDYRDYH